MNQGNLSTGSTGSTAGKVVGVLGNSAKNLELEQFVAALGRILVGRMGGFPSYPNVPGADEVLRRTASLAADYVKARKLINPAEFIDPGSPYTKLLSHLLGMAEKLGLVTILRKDEMLAGFIAAGIKEYVEENRVGGGSSVVAEVNRPGARPDWSLAPEWALWVGYEPRRERWVFFDEKPVYGGGTWHRTRNSQEFHNTPEVKLPLGVDWRETLCQRS